MAVTLLGLRILVTTLYPFTSRIHVYPTHLRIDSLFFGVLLSYFYHFHSAGLEWFVQKHRVWLTAAGAAAIMPPFFLELNESAFMHTAGFSLLYFGFGALMLVILICGHTRFTTPSRWIRSCAYLGSHSYSVYLWHIPVWLWFMRGVLPEFGVSLNYWTEFLAYIAASFAWGVFAAKGIEFPMIRVRDRLFPALTRPIRTD
jgi:peptidoglycan/LPS O-acetylase OafA/YrhL